MYVGSTYRTVTGSCTVLKWLLIASCRKRPTSATGSLPSVSPQQRARACAAWQEQLTCGRATRTTREEDEDNERGRQGDEDEDKDDEGEEDESRAGESRSTGLAQKAKR